MAAVNYKVCDKCGKQIVYIGWTAKIKNVFKKGKTVKILQLLNGNPDGYSYSEREYELCADCTKKLEQFLSRPD